ncbi:MAG TPA: hypothetical protein QGH10_01350, partial [Armatimonadota bacterium]|nr:hypothetical protein [Armatimonadota bacterium]
LQWHHVDLDLLGCLRKFHPDAEAIEIADVWLGLDTARDYALSGFNANPAVCEYRLDNFAIYSPGTDVGLFNVAVTPDEDGAVPEVTYDYDLSDSPTPELEGVTRSTDGTIAFAQVAEGLHYLHAQALGADGAPATPVYTRAVVVDSSPPTVAAITPEPDSKVSGEEFIIALSDVASAIDATTLGVTVNDIGIPADHPAVQLNPLTNHVTVRPALADITFDPDTEIKLALAGCADTLGHAIPEPQVWSYKYDRESDDVAPVAPVIQPPRGPLCVDTFEDGLGEWTPYSTTIAAALSIDDSTAASGTRSLRVYNPKSAGSMGAVVRAEPFDAGVYRYISFDYKLRPEVRIDLYAVVNGDGYSVALSNSDGTNSLGSFENVGLDDQWHHAECDLYSLLKAVAPTAPGYIVTSLILMDAGSYGNIQHQHYNIDNFVIAPVFSATSGAEIGIDADDPSGIAGVSYAFDGARDTVPPAESATSGLIAMLPDLPGGLGWLHARLADGAGNWGEPTHRFLGVDGQAPTAAAGAPAAGAVAATSTVSLSITDAGIAGVDPRSIHLDVGGTVYYVDNAGLTYNGDSGALTWNCEQTTGAPVVFADGQAIEAKLVAAADYAGNPAPELPTWGWTMDYKQDTSAPSIASLAAGTHASYLAHRFEGSTHAVQKYGSDSTATVEVEEGVTPDGTGSSVKIINATAGGNMAAYLYASAYASNSYPYLAFDYMIPAGVTVDLGVYFYNEILWFQMNGNAGGYTATVPNIVADGNWHTCIFNLYEQLAARATAQGLGAYYKATYVILQHRDTAALTAGTAINIDNLFIGASGANAATLSWSATDTTGIAGYSYAIDNAPNTDPPTTPIDAAVTGQFADRPVGMNWFHVRAVDGAGNWGPTSHQAILVQ